MVLYVDCFCAVDTGSMVGGGAGARSSVALGYYAVQHAFKLEEPPPAHAHALEHAPLDDDYRRADDRLDRPTIVSMGS